MRLGVALAMQLIPGSDARAARRQAHYFVNNCCQKTELFSIERAGESESKVRKLNEYLK